MADDDLMKPAKDVVGMVGEVLKAAGDDPQVKEAAKNLGATAVTVTKAINNVLLPIAAVNYGFEKARTYFKDRFSKDIADATAGIPEEHVVEPKASVAGPVLQGLAFSHEEQSLREMYLRLLATAMDGRAAETAHPAFVEIIKQLDAEEARLLRHIIWTDKFTPVVQLRIGGASGHKVALRHLVNLKDSVTKELSENSRYPSMVDNWSRLGLVEVTYDLVVSAPGAYGWVQRRPEYQQLMGLPMAEGESVEIHEGCMSRTVFGEGFAKAVGIA